MTEALARSVPWKGTSMDAVMLAALDEVKDQMRGLNDGNAGQQGPRIVDLLAGHPDAVAVARLTVDRLTAKKVRTKAGEGRPWAKDLLKAADLQNGGA